MGSGWGGADNRGGGGEKFVCFFFCNHSVSLSHTLYGSVSCAKLCTSVVVVDLSEGHLVVVGLGLVAGQRVQRVVAHQRDLVEHGPVAADEAPVGRLDDGAEVVLDGQADVEHLAVVVHVGEVAVLAALAGEGQVERGEEEEVGVHGELEGLVGGAAILAEHHGRAAQHGRERRDLDEHGGGRDGNRGGSCCSSWKFCGRTVDPFPCVGRLYSSARGGGGGGGQRRPRQRPTGNADAKVAYASISSPLPSPPSFLLLFFPSRYLALLLAKVGEGRGLTQKSTRADASAASALLLLVGCSSSSSCAVKMVNPPKPRRTESTPRKKRKEGEGRTFCWQQTHEKNGHGTSMTHRDFFFCRIFSRRFSRMHVATFCCCWLRRTVLVRSYMFRLLFDIPPSCRIA